MENLTSVHRRFAPHRRTLLRHSTAHLFNTCGAMNLTSKQMDTLFFYFNLNDDLMWLIDEYLFDPYRDPW